MSILITGGAGYIGSHTAIELLNSNEEVVIIDNLVNSSAETILKIKKITGKDLKFYEMDLLNKEDLKTVFEENEIKAIIHFAGLKAVGESVEKPLEYYNNNLISTLNLLELSVIYNVKKFVFSSSATVYGDNKSPFVETMELLETTNPYGETKKIIERILRDFSNSHKDFNISVLRYFNPVGAHESGEIGENPKGIPNNIMPYITRVAKRELPILNVFGDDYETKDGTGVRDYIHVVDLAIGHINALKNIKNGINTYNLGTGKGYSVLELITTFERVNNIKIPYKIVGRRSGDIAICYANVEKAKKEINWNPKYTLEDMCRDSWRYEKKQSDL